jgi:poly(A) polymerase
MPIGRFAELGLPLTPVPASSSHPPELTGTQRAAIDELTQAAPVIDELGELFAHAGHDLALVGGSVRDALLGRLGNDLDFATSARPDEILRITKQWRDSKWESGIAFGTVGLLKNGVRLEVTTYRYETYDAVSRKPEVVYGDSLDEDLRRRDFAVNAMALSVPDHVFHDPFGGARDLGDQLLRTPGRPEDSFSDDPLRMMRAARFASQLRFNVDPPVAAAMMAMAERITKVSAERVRDELSKLMCTPEPRRGLALLVDTGLADLVLPEVPKLRLESDEHFRHKDVYEHTLTVVEQAIDLEAEGRIGTEAEGRIGTEEEGAEPDLVLRLAALLHDIGKPATRRKEPGGRVSFHHHEVVGAKMAKARLTALKYPKDVVADVSRLVELHLRFHGYGAGEWTDSAVRRYVRDAGPLLERLHKLTRSDCTTRNKRRAAALSEAYDELERRIEALRQQEEIDALRPELDGYEIGAVLGIPPGPDVGRAYRYLLELRLDAGPIGNDAASAALRQWATEHGVG